MIRAIMHGCNGHMGQTITGLCADDEQIEIVAGVDPFEGIKMTTRYSPAWRPATWRRM